MLCERGRIRSLRRSLWSDEYRMNQRRQGYSIKMGGNDLRTNFGCGLVRIMRSCGIV